jgi:hypothetical protein
VTNLSKWFVAIPFTLLVAVVTPALVAGDLLWFCQRWTDTLYLVLSAGMWLVATAFVDVKCPAHDRGGRGIAQGARGWVCQVQGKNLATIAMYLLDERQAGNSLACPERGSSVSRDAT